MVHCSEYVRRSYAGNRFFRGYRHEVAVSAGLMDANSTSLRPHVPRALTRTEPVRVGMIARLDPIKNQRLVIEAFRPLLDSYPGAILEFIGDGSEMGRLKARALELKVADRVLFHGRVPDPFSLMRDWDLFLYGTTGAEGFGAALAEAMCLGLPCVVTDVGPMREVGGEEEAVKYVSAASAADFSQAAIALLGDYEERCRMSMQARKRATTAFDGSRFARRIAELLVPDIEAHSGRRVDMTAA